MLKKTLVALFTAAGLVMAAASTAPVALADTGASCGSAAKVSSDIFKELDKLLKTSICKSFVACSAAAEVAKLSSQLVSFWNQAANNSWATIGPRRLDANTFLTGRLVSTGGRLFVAPTPARSDSITVTIDELDGKGKTGVAICLTSKSGNTRKVKEMNFNLDNDAKKNEHEKRTFTVTGAAGSILSVHLDGKSVGNTFQYKLRAAQ